MKQLLCLAIASLLAHIPASAVVTIDWVTVGDPGNQSDPETGFGSVSYSYNISRYEVTIGQYADFLNAGAKSDPYGLYNPLMESDLNIAGISRAGDSGSYVYTTIGSPNRPITYVSWFDAARFANWMHNGKGSGSTETGAYKLAGATTGDYIKEVDAKCWIPTENEWYKAAYFHPTEMGGDIDGYWLYPTASNILGSNVVGTGDANYRGVYYAATQEMGYFPTENYLTEVGAYPSRSYYGTCDQGGNVIEWNEAILPDSQRGVRGGYWDYHEYDLRSSARLFAPSVFEDSTLGFRLAGVPEPDCWVLLAISSHVALIRRRR